MDGPGGRISAMLRQVSAVKEEFTPELITESEIIYQVSEAVVEIFRGCHSDSRKVTMYLR